MNEYKVTAKCSGGGTEGRVLPATGGSIISILINVVALMLCNQEKLYLGEPLG